MFDCKRIDTLMMMNPGLQMRKERNMVDRTQYQKLVGKLTYLFHTRADFSYLISVVSRFMYSPYEHLDAIYKFPRYLKKTQERGVAFKKNDHVKLHAYTDTLGWRTRQKKIHFRILYSSWRKFSDMEEQEAKTSSIVKCISGVQKNCVRHYKIFMA